MPKSLIATWDQIRGWTQPTLPWPDPWGTRAAAGGRKWLNSRDATLSVTFFPMEVRTSAVTLG